MRRSDPEFRELPLPPRLPEATDDALIDELSKRKRIQIVSANNVVDGHLIREGGYQQHMERQQGQMIGHFISDNALCQTDITIQAACPEHPEQATFSMYALVITPMTGGGH